MDLTESIAPRSDQERWVAVPDYEGIYEVSDLGRVRSLDRIISDGHRRRGLVLKPVKHPGGYHMVNLWRSNVQNMQLVHRIVLIAFVGPPPAGFEAMHGDGDATNAALWNLSWGTHSDNEYDQVDHGTHHHAAKTHCPSGHPYDDDNTYTYPGPRAHRGCRACRRDYARNYARARKAA